MIELLELKFSRRWQTKLNLIGRIHHVTHLRANSVHLVTIQVQRKKVKIRRFGPSPSSGMVVGNRKDLNNNRDKMQ